MNIPPRIPALSPSLWLALVTGALALPAWAQDALTYTELKAKAPVVQSRADLLALMPGAKMSRINEKGNRHAWVNELNGEMVISSDNRETSGIPGAKAGRASTAPGKWSVTDDGRFCMVIQWKKGESEETCRFVLKTADGYYAVNELNSDGHKAFKLTISN